MDVSALSADVCQLLVEAADRAVRPRFRRLVDGEVTEKSAGELVTVADRDAEAVITAGLHQLAPGVPVVGEEAAADDPSIRRALSEAQWCWLVDPLDGTANFIDGSPDYGVMVALLRHGEPAGAWVWQPEHGHLWTAVAGEGTRRDGALIRVPDRPSPADTRVAVLSRFLDDATRSTVDANRSRFASVEEGPRCAAVTYPALIEGRYDAVLFWRTLPWDHAPGALLLSEAGGIARRPDGTAYDVGGDRVGLLAVADAPSWSEVREALLGPVGSP